MLLKSKGKRMVSTALV